MIDWWVVGKDWARENKLWVIGGGLGLLVLVLGVGRWWMSREPMAVEVISGGESQEEPIWVDVAGAVEAAGVYELNAGARVKDALAAAGGLSSAADRNFVARFVNLAQEVVDGAKIYVPVKGESAPTTVQSGGEGVAGATAERININTASLSQLESLWGVGEARAKAIVEGRPYASVEELKSKKIVPGNVYQRIKDQVSVW